VPARKTRILIAGLILSAAVLPLQAQVAWVVKFDEALKQAKAEQKFIVVDISASWCGPCRQMAREVYPNKDFIEFSRSQVFMLLDAETDDDGVKLTGRFSVHAYPTILVLDSQGKEIDRLIGASSAADLIRDLREVFANPIPYDQLTDRARSQMDDFKDQFDAWKRSYQRQDYEKARQFLGRASKLSSTATTTERFNTQAWLTIACFRDRKYQEALDALDSMSRLDEKSTAESKDLRLLRARILVALNRHDEAFADMNALLRSSPPRSTKESIKELLAEMPGKYRKGDREYQNAVAKAQDSLKKKKFDESIVLAGKAEALAPQDPQAHLLIATAHLQSSGQEPDPVKKAHHLATGLQELRMARLLDPEDMSSFLAVKGYLASRYLRFQPTAPEAQKNYNEAESRFAERRYQEAMAAYSKTIQLEPDFGKAYLHLGDCYFGTENFAEALKWYLQAAAKSPADASAYRFAADALARLGRINEANRGLVLGVLADPEYPLIRAIGGVQLERHGSVIPLQFLLLSADEESVDETMFDAVPAETVPAWREHARAKILWRREKFRATFPGESFYHATFEEEYDCLNKLIEKWNTLKEADRSLRNDGLDFLRQVSIDSQLDSFVYLELFTEEYRPSFEKWKGQNGERAAMYVTSFLCGRPQAKSQGTYNSSALEVYNAGVASQKAGDPPKAIELYQRALAQEPNMVPALTNLSVLYTQSGDRENARTILKRWLDMQPESTQAMAMAAWLDFQDGDFASATALYQKAADLEQNPDLKANHLRNLEMVQSASRHQQPVLIRPPSGSSPLQAAVEAMDDSRWREAISILEKLYPSLPDGPSKNQVELMLSIAHLNSGNLKEARTYITRLLAKDPTNAIAQQILKAIDK
jgi:tetratricopeptide (TPR) repeat protein